MASSPSIPDGTYRIRSASNTVTVNTFLTRNSTNGVFAQPLVNNASQLWRVSRSSDGDFEINSTANAQEPLRISIQTNQLVCSTGRRVTWNIESRNSGTFVIGLASNGHAIQLPSNRNVPVSVVTRTNSAQNGARQRWIFDPDPLSPQSVLNSLIGFWRINWLSHPWTSHEGLLNLRQVSNGVAQGNAHDTMGRRYPCTVRHISGNRVQFDFTAGTILGVLGPPFLYEATISADRSRIIGVGAAINYTRIS